MNSSNSFELFPSPPLIRWLPDETVYSLASRFHRLSCNSRANQTARQLFGHSRGGYPHDLPSGLRYLSETFAGNLGSVESIARERTVLPFFLVFREQAQHQRALFTMAGTHVGSLKMHLGLPASRLGARCAVKACRECMVADQLAHGTAYWHRNHQFPGMWVCLRHGAPLSVSVTDQAGENRFGWSLPEERELAPDFKFEAPALDALHALAQLVNDATNHLGTIEGLRISKAILLRLKELDLARADGRLRVERVASEFNAFLGSMHAAPDIASLSAERGALYGHVLHALRTPASGHALRQLLVVHWLFGSWAELLMYCIQSDSAVSVQSQGDPVEDSDVEVNRRRLITLVVEGKLSTTAAAREVGVAVVTAQRWMASVGVGFRRRASKLTCSALSRLISDLASGADIQSAADRAGVSATSAHRVLRTEIGLIARRKSAQAERRQKNARREWQLAVRSGASLKLARALTPKAFAWLYRNDREWLNQTKPVSVRSSGRRLDWAVRDATLSTRLQQAALRLREKDGRRQIKVVDLVREVPDLKAKLRVLQKLPITARVLAMITQRAEIVANQSFLDWRDRRWCESPRLE